MSLLPSSLPRLHVTTDLAAGKAVELAREQSNYLLNVLRLGAGDGLLAFNGRDGEWQMSVVPTGRKSAHLVCVSQTRPQSAACELHYLFAPLKHARLDYMAQKAVEMGAGRLVPVLTRRTQVSRLNLERMAANAVEAAEQCGILALPEIVPERKLEQALAELEPDRLLVFCDEDAPQGDGLKALTLAKPGPLALLIGPEGGFDPSERQMILAHPAVLRLSLGPRILRADTAAVAALALVQATLGDWQNH
ncbi:MAG: 16S rRNA (uracil(1498)-N(3))-methyltransferase [Bosea sp. (in: a-proteobacteria)]